MIDGIGKSGTGRLEPQRGTSSPSIAGVAAGPKIGGQREPGVGGVVASLVAGGPPVDSDRVAAVRQAIADGRYTVDPERIAEAMLASDLDIK
jgi:negative regulator of flagellin synthesis FlgM